MKIIYKICYNCFANNLPDSGNAFLGKISQKIRAYLFNKITGNKGKNINVQRKCYFDSKVTLDDNSGIGTRCSVQGPCDIGKNVMMGPDVTILTRNHEFSRTDIPMIEQGFKEYKKVIIEDDVWIGTKTIILPGVKVGTGSIIAAGAVVTKDVDEYSIMAGCPAKCIKKRK